MLGLGRQDKGSPPSRQAKTCSSASKKEAGDKKLSRVGVWEVLYLSWFLSLFYLVFVLALVLVLVLSCLCFLLNLEGQGRERSKSVREKYVAIERRGKAGETK